MSGGISYNGWDAESEFSIDKPDSSIEWGFGIYVANKGFSEIVKSVADKDAKSPNVAWMTKVNLGMICKFIRIVNPFSAKDELTRFGT